MKRYTFSRDGKRWSVESEKTLTQLCEEITGYYRLETITKL